MRLVQSLEDGRIKVFAFRQRYVTCASCRAGAVAMVTVDDAERGATACDRHVSTWVMRATKGLK